MIIKDYEMIRNSCKQEQIVLNPELRGKPELEGKDFQMSSMRIRHNCLFMHWHNHFEIVPFNSCDAVCYVDGQSFSISEGDTLFVNCGQIHAAYSTNNKEMAFSPIIFDKSIFADYSGDTYFSSLISPILEGRFILSNINSKDNSDYSGIRNIIMEIIQGFEGKSLSGYQLCIRAKLLEVLVKVSGTSRLEGQLL